MDERAACALLKARFEAAGFQIEENRPFEQAGVAFEIDGFDPTHRVGYEYVTSDAGDGWDVDASVIETLAEQRRKGELFVLIVDETEAPDADSLTIKADAFLAEIPRPAADDDDTAADDHADRAATDEDADNAPERSPPKARAKSPTKKPAIKKPAAKKPAKKPAAKKKR